jgi:G3E family GTPase
MTMLASRAPPGSGMGNTAVAINEFSEIRLDHLPVEAVGQEIVEPPRGCLSRTVAHRGYCISSAVSGGCWFAEV